MILVVIELVLYQIKLIIVFTNRPKGHNINFFKHFTIMCAFVKGSLNFSVRPVAVGQKGASVNADPQLVVASTVGKFTLTPAAGLAMALEPGQSVGFLDNLADVLAAVAAKQPEVLEVFEENGLDINNPDDVDVFVTEMREVRIFKGYDLYEADGSRTMANARTSKEEKEQMLNEHFDEILEQVREQIVANLKAKANDENYVPTEDEIRACVTIDLVGSKQEPAIYGSKVATTANQTGLGLTLSFSDTNIWNSLKRGIDPDARTKSKSTYKVDTKNPIMMTFNDGFKDVTVATFALEFVKTEEVSGRNND